MLVEEEKWAYSVVLNVGVYDEPAPPLYVSPDAEVYHPSKVYDVVVLYHGDDDVLPVEVDDLDALGRVIVLPVSDDVEQDPPLLEALNVTVYPLDAKLAVIVLLAVTVPDALLHELNE